MKILQVVPTFGSGGAEHFVLEISNELCRQGHNVDILTLYDVPDENPLRKALNSRIGFYSLNKKKGLELHIFKSILRFIKQQKYDVVHGHVRAIMYMTLATIMCKNVRFVATIHSEASREAGKYFDKWSRKLMFGMKKCIPVTISEESELSFEKFYGMKAAMVFNGVSGYVKKKDIQLRDNVNQVVFLHPASCQRVKNQELLFKAFNQLLDDGYDAKIVWVGSNKSFYELFNSLKSLMKQNVIYLGLVDNIRDYMKAADAMCLSSKMEGMPMTIIEAFSVGCPVLCTPVGGCINMIEKGKNGMMSDDLTVESYYRMLKAYVTLSLDERAKMSANAFASFPPYNVENCVKGYLKVYESRNSKQ